MSVERFFISTFLVRRFDPSPTVKIVFYRRQLYQFFFFFLLVPSYSFNTCDLLFVCPFYTLLSRYNIKTAVIEYGSLLCSYHWRWYYRDAYFPPGKQFRNWSSFQHILKLIISSFCIYFFFPSLFLKYC